MLLLRLLAGLWFENMTRRCMLLLSWLLAGFWFENRTRASSMLLRLLAGLWFENRTRGHQMDMNGKGCDERGETEMGWKGGELTGMEYQQQSYELYDGVLRCIQNTVCWMKIREMGRYRRSRCVLVYTTRMIWNVVVAVVTDMRICGEYTQECSGTSCGSEATGPHTATYTPTHTCANILAHTYVHLAILQLRMHITRLKAITSSHPIPLPLPSINPSRLLVTVCHEHVHTHTHLRTAHTHVCTSGVCKWA